MEDSFEYISQIDIILSKRPFLMSYLCPMRNFQSKRLNYSYDATYHLKPKNWFPGGKVFCIILLFPTNSWYLYIYIHIYIYMIPVRGSLPPPPPSHGMVPKPAFCSILHENVVFAVFLARWLAGTVCKPANSQEFMQQTFRKRVNCNVSASENGLFAILHLSISYPCQTFSERN